MYNLENNVEWTEELKTAFKKNTTYGSLIFHKEEEEEETLTGKTITTGDNSGNTGELTLAGETSQESTNGYQLIAQPSQSTTNTYAGIIYTSSSNGTYTIRGTATSDSTRVLDLATGILGGTESTHFSSLEAGDYNYNISSIRGTTTNLKIKPRSGITDLADYSLGQNFNISSDINNFNLYIEIERGKSINVSFKIMLEKGTTVHSWEKYTGGIPAPNANFPQQIKVVKGNNTIKVARSTQNQTYSINLPEGFELCKIGDYVDEFVYQDNTWYKNKKIQKVILMVLKLGKEQAMYFIFNLMIIYIQVE